jgi:hypothetical protein
MTQRQMFILLGFIIMAPLGAKAPTEAWLFGAFFLVLSFFAK